MRSLLTRLSVAALSGLSGDVDVVRPSVHYESDRELIKITAALLLLLLNWGKAC